MSRTIGFFADLGVLSLGLGDLRQGSSQPPTMPTPSSMPCFESCAMPESISSIPRVDRVGERHADGRTFAAPPPHTRDPHPRPQTRSSPPASSLPLAAKPSQVRLRRSRLPDRQVSLGHSITRTFPALVPLVLSDAAAGTTARPHPPRHARPPFRHRKKLASFTNSTLCTHFGSSGSESLTSAATAIRN